jgi:aminopeptidase YwaD
MGHRGRFIPLIGLILASGLLLACQAAVPARPTTSPRPLAEVAQTATPVPAARTLPLPTAPLAPSSGGAPATAASFQVEAAYAHAQMLAEQIGPRPAGSENDRRAADYIAAQLASAGYLVERQPFTFTAYIDEGTRVELQGADSQTLEASTLLYSAAGEVTAPLVFAGLARPQDLRGLDVRGRIVLAERGEIRFSDKVANAAAAGAVGVIIYNNTGGRLQGTLASPSAIPAAAVDRATGDLLRSRVGATVRLSVRGQVQETATTNIIGTLPGQTDEVLILGAHYDSVPVSPGANDNGSGVAVVLEVARVLASQGSHVPTIRVIAFGGEENGLLGSKRYVETLPNAALKQVIAMINLDMVGVGDTWQAGGSRSIVDRLRAATAPLGIRWGELPSDFAGSSDHASFAAVGVPVVFLYLADDPNYHTPEDKVRYLQPERLAQAGAAALALIAQLERR